MSIAITYPNTRVGRVIYPAATPGTLLMAADTVYCLPWSLGGLDTTWVDQLGLRVSTAGAGAGNTLIAAGLYEDRNGEPGRALVRAEFAGNAAAGPAVTLSSPLPLPALVWCVTLAGSFGTTQPTVAAMAAGGQTLVTTSLGVPNMVGLPTAAAAVPQGWTASRARALGLPEDFAGITLTPTAGGALPFLGARVLAVGRTPA